VPLFLYDDHDDPATLAVVMEFQYGGVNGTWYDKPLFVDMKHTVGPRFEHTFGPYITEGDFRIRFTVRVTDSAGAVAQMEEHIILVRSCPPVPEPPVIQWVDSGDALVLNSTVDGRNCTSGVPDTKTVTTQAFDATTPADKLQVYLVYMYADSTGWLPQTLASVPMAHVGSGRYSATLGPYSVTRDYQVGYYAAVRDADGAVATTERDDGQLAVADVPGCVVIR
jgi:hypothetical protein